MSLSRSGAESRSKLTAQNLAYDQLEASESSDGEVGNDGSDQGLIPESLSQPPLSHYKNPKKLAGNAGSDAGLPMHLISPQTVAPGAIFND